MNNRLKSHLRYQSDYSIIQIAGGALIIMLAIAGCRFNPNQPEEDKGNYRLNALLSSKELSLNDTVSNIILIPNNYNRSIMYGY